MKMIYVTDIMNNNNKVAVGTCQIVAVFKLIEGEHVGKTCVTLNQWTYLHGRRRL